MLSGSIKNRLELEGIAAFRSIIEPFFQSTIRKVSVSQLKVFPMIWWLELIAVAKLKQSPSPFKSVIRPFFHN